MDAKTILRPYRALFKSIGQVREGHIAILLVQELEALDAALARHTIAALKSVIDRDYRQFQQIAAAQAVAHPGEALRPDLAVQTPAVHGQQW